MDNRLYDEEQELQKQPPDSRLVSVYKAPHELAAVTIRSLLEEEGYPAVIRSFQVPMYDSIAMMMRPHWGEVLVREEDLRETRVIVSEYLSSIETEKGTDE